MLVKNVSNILGCLEFIDKGENSNARPFYPQNVDLDSILSVLTNAGLYFDKVPTKENTKENHSVTFWLSGCLEYSYFVVFKNQDVKIKLEYLSKTFTNTYKDVVKCSLRANLNNQFNHVENSIKDYFTRLTTS